MFAGKLAEERTTMNPDEFTKQVGINVTFCSNEQQTLNKIDHFSKDRQVNSSWQRGRQSSADFVESLICKIKSVERLKAKSIEQAKVKVQEGSYTERQINHMSSREETKKKQYRQQSRIDNIVHQNQNPKIGNKSRQLQAHRYFQQQFLKLREQNKELRQKIKRLTAVLQSYASNIKHKENQQAKKDQYIAELKYAFKEKENIFRSQMMQIVDKNTLLERQNQRGKFQETKHNRKYNLCIVKSTINQVIFPSIRQSPKMTQMQLKQINIETASLKRSFQLSYNQLKESKDLQIENMRQAFFQNLNNFKGIILKHTSNSIQLANNLLQKNVPQNRIIQISFDPSASSS